MALHIQMEARGDVRDYRLSYEKSKAGRELIRENLNATLRNSDLQAKLQHYNR